MTYRLSGRCGRQVFSMLLRSTSQPFLDQPAGGGSHPEGAWKDSVRLIQPMVEPCGGARSILDTRPFSGETVRFER